ncbi:MAG: DsbA family protein [Candidatus Nanohalobium sp.]
MTECDFCGEEFDDEYRLHAHWLEEHEDELNSHQREKAKKGKQKLEEEKDRKQKRRKRRLYQGVGAAVVLIAAVFLGSQLLPSGTASKKAAEIDVKGEPMLGSENASVTVVEFGDFECPACGNFEQSVFSRIKSNYIDTGKIKFYWKDFPLQMHPWAREAASTLECVHRQDEEAFWDVKSRVFSNQESLNQGNVRERIMDWASKQGVNTSDVSSCNGVNEVIEDKNQGLKLGVDSTPSVYVNGEEVSPSYQEIRQAIESELK